MTHAESKQLVAAAADITARFRASKRHERRNLIIEAAGLGLRIAVIDGQPTAVAA